MLWDHEQIIASMQELHYCWNSTDSSIELPFGVEQSPEMLTQIYIQALLVDEELADQDWEAWDADKIDDQMAYIAWWLIVNAGRHFHR